MDLGELAVERTKNIEEIRHLIDVVYKYVAKNKLIVYGGQAIDYALRLKDSSIYADYEIPDYDFYSPNNVINAYELFKLLIEEGKGDLSVIPAYHRGTMRVRFLSSYYIADVTYTSGISYNIGLLSALKYKDIYIKSPYLQYSDQCRAFAYPFEIAGPQPTILFRYKKDMARFMKLYEKYPINKELVKDFAKRINVKEIRSNVDFKSGNKHVLSEKYVYSGVVAYHIYLSLYKKRKPDSEILINRKISVFSDSPKGKIQKLDGNMIHGIVKGEVDYVIPSHEIGINEIELHGKTIRFVSIQFLIIYFYSL
ncbi:MAG: hypothetical protein CMM93_01715, partial [Rickettsiales bacterium]|nr:hypothetical protein [Rickettsiales bacterium]